MINFSLYCWCSPWASLELNFGTRCCSFWLMKMVVFHVYHCGKEQVCVLDVLGVQTVHLVVWDVSVPVSFGKQPQTLSNLTPSYRASHNFTNSLKCWQNDWRWLDKLWRGRVHFTFLWKKWWLCEEVWEWEKRDGNTCCFDCQAFASLLIELKEMENVFLRKVCSFKAGCFNCSLFHVNQWFHSSSTLFITMETWSDVIVQWHNMNAYTSSLGGNCLKGAFYCCVIVFCLCQYEKRRKVHRSMSESVMNWEHHCLEKTKWGKHCWNCGRIPFCNQNVTEHHEEGRATATKTSMQLTQKNDPESHGTHHSLASGWLHHHTE